jgi:TetR/AcrR family transcriptional repressor of nem operon
MSRPLNSAVRTRLLSTGRQIIHDRGFNGCGLLDITTAASVSKSAFYSHFDSKVAFAEDILEDYWASLESLITPVLQDARIGPLKRIEQFFRMLVGNQSPEDIARGCLIGNLSLELANTNPDVRLKLSDLLRRWETALAQCLREAQALGELAAGRNPDELAAVILEAWQGAVMRCKVDRNDHAYRRFEAVVLSQLLRSDMR